MDNSNEFCLGNSSYINNTYIVYKTQDIREGYNLFE